MDWVIRRFHENWPQRETKGDYGRLAIIGGSDSFSNTPAIVGRAAVRAGIDIPHIIAPRRAADMSGGFGLDLITEPLDGQILEPSMVDTVCDALDHADAFVIGNGLGRDPKTMRAVEKILAETTIPVVIDADALYAGLKDVDLKDRPSILTPHAGEFEHLYEEVGDTLALKKEQLAKAARIYQSTIVLKGERDVISNGSERTTNETGNPVMTKGGTGDMLSGIIGTLLCTHETFTAAAIGTRAAGEAGDHAADEYGEAAGVGDIIDAIRTTLIHNDEARSSSTDR
ncbi:MAG: NAD(P)H-hydrate dehydratase [Candidatus Nanohaloarchaeota archaeon QJJ-5]|nr:NAD(P)H-hydrate dehydratase [Candidatus Nanohaloarchaeota archaeon QJJ-5]